jgi:hypothetical protein
MPASGVRDERPKPEPRKRAPPLGKSSMSVNARSCVNMQRSVSGVGLRVVACGLRVSGLGLTGPRIGDGRLSVEERSWINMRFTPIWLRLRSSGAIRFSSKLSCVWCVCERESVCVSECVCVCVCVRKKVIVCVCVLQSTSVRAYMTCMHVCRQAGKTWMSRSASMKGMSATASLQGSQTIINRHVSRETFDSSQVRAYASTSRGESPCLQRVCREAQG